MPRVALPERPEETPFALAFSTYATKIASAAVNFTLAAYQNSLLTLRELEGARYRTALINGCQVCKSARGTDSGEFLRGCGGDMANSPFARGPAPDGAFYDAVPQWQTSALFSARERIAIEMAERMGERPHSMAGDEDFWARVHRHFSDEEIVDMTLTIGSWISMGRVVHTLELDEICRI